MRKDQKREMITSNFSMKK